MALRSSDVVPNADREHQRQKYRSQVATALNEEDDPLAVYHQFVQWTVKNYGEKDPSSGLLELLEEATRQFKEDPIYKTDLRYLKLWALYARQMDRSGAIAIFSFLVANEIGTSYSALYEDYAILLEQDGRLQEADMIYKKGVKRQVRPLERLKNRYREFRGRTESLPSSISSGSSMPNAQVTQFHSTPASTSSISSPSSSTVNHIVLNSTAASRYAVMLAPPAPGKRPEKLRFNMSLLFTDEHVEYCIQESRARSMGLLGKKWPPPLAESSRFSASSSSSSSSTPVDFNDDGQKSTRLLGGRRRSLMGGGPEPTVTINTKEALADVFGMYNSPEKTTRLAVPGSKYAPVKKIEPVTPVVPSRIAFSRENDNAGNAKPPTGFQPFVDENAQPRTTPGAKFTPFVDPKQNRTPFITPRPALQAKELTTPASNTQRANSLKLKPVQEEKPPEVVFSKVFTPAQIKPVPLAPLRDVFTDDHGKPLPKPKVIPTHERAKSHHDLSSPPEEGSRTSPFTPFLNENAPTPFKVFSRPPEQDKSAEGIFTPKTPSVFTPFTDPRSAFKPFKDAPPTFKPFIDQGAAEDEHPLEPVLIPEAPGPSWTNSVTDSEENDSEEEEEEEEEKMEDAQYLDQAEYEEEDSQLEQYEIPLAPEHLPEEYEEEHSYQEVPLGGRFGQFNVMTPITERTFEFTTSTRGATPSDRFGRPLQDGDGSPRDSVFIPPRHDEHEAVEAAERLVAELQHRSQEEDELETSDSIESLQLTAPQHDDPDVAIIEERTGSLSLVDTLTLNSKFRPPNPCNPFDLPILSTLLSRIPTDPYFHDLRDRPSRRLDELQKFSKKSRKASGSNSNNTGTLEMSAHFPLTLEGNRFNISEKIGEGGFGCVFKARDLGTRMGDEDEDEEDEEEEEEGSSLVALKVVKPKNLWEYHVLRRLHSALPPSLRRSIVLPHALYAYSDESYLILDFCPQGMLLNIVNNAVAAGVSQPGACLDELLVMFFSIDLLRLLEGMHNVGIIHGDLKIDNCLLRLEDIPGGNSAWSSIYQPSGDGGWSCKGLKVIDFGRTIDTRLFPPDQQYIAEWPTDERDCFEIREKRPWTYQTDYYGLAGIVYCMLFGKYIQANSVVPVSPEEHRYKISTPFKRYWQTELWSRLFDVLLNPGFVRTNGELPICDELGALRKEMETWLQANCNRTSNTLKGLLKKVEMSCYVR